MMKRVLFLLLCFIICVCADKRYDIEGRVNNLNKPSQARVLVDGHVACIPRSDGTFTIHMMTSGSHVVEVQSTEFYYPSMRVEVGEANLGSGKSVRAWAMDETGKKSLTPYPLVFTPKFKPNYFEVKEQFSYGVFLKNPMVIMMLFTGLMVFVTPKLMDNMDPEELKEMQKRQEEMGDPSKMWSNLFGGNSEEQTETPAITSAKESSKESAKSRRAK
eukprot:TRINITY_DN1236_c0_g1::TRINITY_DN1236_c0_g1_i1::g.26912::m.26912 TRINITY_DN1236_c0_g1::TRINITY_DN1236_c0_g1_i1::g.26912  ORF type:complete len:231 (-),score=72.44,sp/A5PJA8/EMC7_BOVIN/33.52/2e-19,DUF2012/PF09430.5/6.7e-22,CarboxypepD_reg/PF13620.1/0.24 TRINITY_DN1236_c0_g1_i1:821-1471(-)